MLTTSPNFIPVLTSDAGLCLTQKNWQEVAITTASYSLESLLYKPGRAILSTITDLKSYFACPGELVLNAATLVANNEGMYHLKSPYDGSKITCSISDLLNLIQNLKPDAVILPKNIIQDYPLIWNHWNNSITPFIHTEDLKKQTITITHGVYFSSTDEIDWEQFKPWSHIPRYVLGNFESEIIQSLHAQGIQFIETDEPAKIAMQGIVYTAHGMINLTHAEVAMQFEPIDNKCICPTCTQKLSKAYLHHLLNHTPLLCQRFLIQHNVSYLTETRIHDRMSSN